MASQTQIASGREIGAVFGRLLLNITTVPYSWAYLTVLKIDPPLATAVLSLEIGYYENMNNTKHQ